MLLPLRTKTLLPPQHASRFCYPAGEAVPTIAVNPEILLWARKTAGLTPQQAVKRLPVADTKKLAGAERLAALERGDVEPSVTMLERMAKLYHRPVLVFHLPSPPASREYGADFRSKKTCGSPDKDALLAALVRDMWGRQDMIRDALESEAEPDEIPFIGALPRDNEVGTDTHLLFTRIRREPSIYRELINQSLRIIDNIMGSDFTIDMFYKKSTPTLGFKLLRSRIEEAGVFVLLQGNLGSYHTNIDPMQFRGLAIADRFAPFIVINENDSRTAWNFTLMHELTHLVLGSSGLSGSARSDTLQDLDDRTSEPIDNQSIEYFCNEVASNWLLSEDSLGSFELHGGESIDHLKSCIRSFSTERNLSQSMVTVRLAKAHMISPIVCHTLLGFFRDQWIKHKKAKSNRAAVKSLPFNDYGVRRHRIGPKLINFSRRMLSSRELSTTRLATVLNVNPRSVGKLLDRRIQQ